MTTQTIPKGWTRTTLGEVVFPISETYDFTGKTTVHFLNTGDILEGKLLHNELCDIYLLPGQAKKSFHLGDILYSEIRPENKRYMLVDYDASNSVASTKLMVLRTKDIIDKKFIYIILTSEDTIKEFQFIAESRSGTFPQITFDSISFYPISLPPLPEQRAIAAVLSSLDDKIELLRNNNKTLEGIAQALFKRWFVDFEFPAEIIKNSPPVKEGWQTKSDGVVNNKNPLKTFRKKLRNNLTPAEAKLWTYLQNSKLDGRKFRRQHSVDNYILDFYCPSEKLAVELDGEVHNNPIQAEYDYERDLFLRYYGIKVLRFENKLVFENPDYLLNRIREAFGKQSPPPTTPPFGHPSLPGGEFLGYKSSGGKMIDSELGKIPEGWRVGRLGDVIQILGGGTPKTNIDEYWNGDIPWFSVVDAPNDGGVYAITCAKHISKEGLENSATQVLPVNTTIITARGTVGKLALTGVPMAMNQSCYGIRSKKNKSVFYIHMLIKESLKILKGRTHGAVFDTITSDTLNDIPHVTSTENIIDNCENVVRPIFNKILQNNFQIQTLTRLRDSLLPKLMKGEVRVKGFCKGE